MICTDLYGIFTDLCGDQNGVPLSDLYGDQNGVLFGNLYGDLHLIQERVEKAERWAPGVESRVIQQRDDSGKDRGGGGCPVHWQERPVEVYDQVVAHCRHVRIA